MHTLRSKKRLTLLVFLLFLSLGALVRPSVADAQGPVPGDKVIFGSSFVLKSGQRLDGDLAVFGGTVTIEQGASVNGDVSVIGGAATINGVINGDVVALGGVIHLGRHGVINGDATAIGGLIEREPGSRVLGNIVDTLEKEEGILEITPVPQEPGWRLPLQGAVSEPLGWIGRSILRGLGAIAWTAILAALGVFLILLAPTPTERVARSIKANPLLAFAVGFGASFTAGIAALVLAITICLLPLAMAILLAMLSALLFGWLALGWLLGKELLKAFSAENATPIWEVIVGVAVLTLLWKLPTVFPFVGGLASFMVMFVAGNIAMGGVVLTRFGSRDYPASPTPTVSEAAPSPERSLPEASAVSAAAHDEKSEPLVPPPPTDV